MTSVNDIASSLGGEISQTIIEQRKRVQKSFHTGEDYALNINLRVRYVYHSSSDLQRVKTGLFYKRSM